MSYVKLFLAAANEGVRSVPTLGEPVVLGGLYAGAEDKFIPGLALWDSPVVEEYTTTLHHPHQQIQWSSSQKKDDKYKMLNIKLSGRAVEL